MFEHISQDEAQALMRERHDLLVLDVRRPDEYAEGHIPGAVNLPNETIDGDEIDALPDYGRTILVYCRSGRRSLDAARKLSDMGYTDVRDFGGIMTWTGPIER